MRIVLVGAVHSTRIALETMVKCGTPPVLLMTLPQEKSSRHSDYVDLTQQAGDAGVEVYYAANGNAPEALDKLRSVDPDYVLVIGWSQICRAEFLSIPRLGAIGFHPAPLPENRGRAVVPWTILQRRTETGISLFWLDDGMDSGPLLIQKMMHVEPDETATTLYNRQLDCLRAMLEEAIRLLQSANPPRIEQDHSRASYCAKRTPADGLIDWSRPAEEIWTLIRATTRPYPGAFTIHKGQKLVIWEADLIGEAPYFGLAGQVQAFSDKGALVQCGDGQHVLIRSVQRESEEPMHPAEILKMHDKLGIDLWALFQRIYHE